MASNKNKTTVVPKDERKGRAYRAEMAKSVTIEPGDQIEGVFQGEKEVSITDHNTGVKKDVRVYQFRDRDGKKFVVLGRFMLDQGFDELYEKEGGHDKVVGCNIAISRGDDEKLPGKRTMGTYELTIWEE